MQRPDDPARRNGEAKHLPKQCGDLRDGQAQLRVEHGGQTDRLRPELHRRRADGVRRLEPMATLDAPTAARAVADFDAKFADLRPHRRQVFLILRDDVKVDDCPVTVRTRAVNLDVVVFLDMRRHGPVPMPSVGRTRFAAGTLRRRPRSALGKGRSLTIPGATRGLKFSAQSLILVPEPIAFAFELRDAITKRVVLLTKRLRGWGRRGRSAFVLGRHVDVMSHLAAQYK
jgi:hypothetical protein